MVDNDDRVHWVAKYLSKYSYLLAYTIIAMDWLETITENYIDDSSKEWSILWVFVVMYLLWCIQLLCYGFYLYATKGIDFDKSGVLFTLSDVVTLLVFVLWFGIGYTTILIGEIPEVSVKLLANILLCVFLYIWYFLQTHKNLNDTIRPTNFASFLRHNIKWWNVGVFIFFLVDVILVIVIGALTETSEKANDGRILLIFDNVLLAEFLGLLWRCSLVRYYPQASVNTAKSAWESIILVTTLGAIMIFYTSENITVYLRKVVYPSDDNIYLLIEDVQIIIDSFLLLVLAMCIILSIYVAFQKTEGDQKSSWFTSHYSQAFF
jgi:hypothetical protein